jgi:predicted RND superfamily exporter protein
MFSQFGGTQALGLLISITLLIAMITNLIVLPSLLLSFERTLTTKSFEEPYFDAYSEESEINWSDLQLSTDEDLKVDLEKRKEEE